jgi:hypothetical protein
MSEDKPLLAALMAEPSPFVPEPPDVIVDADTGSPGWVWVEAYDDSIRIHRTDIPGLIRDLADILTEEPS